MATKLRKFSTYKIIKMIAFFGIVFCVTTFVVQLQYLKYKDYNPECITVKEYKDSNEFGDEIFKAYHIIFNALYENELPPVTNFYYLISNGIMTYSNPVTADKKYLEECYDFFYACEDGVWSTSKNANLNMINDCGLHFSKNDTVYFAFSNAFMKKKQLEWKENRENLNPIFVKLVVLFAITLLLFIYQIVVTGRRPKDKKLHLSKIDTVYSDVLIFLIIIITSFSFLGSTNGKVYDSNRTIAQILAGTITVIEILIAGVLSLSLIRKIKAHTILKNSLIYLSCEKVYDFVKCLFDGRKFEKYPLTKALFNRQLIFISTSFVLFFMTIILLYAETELFLLMPIIEITIIYWYIKGNNKTFEEINDGFIESLDDQMKAERMKIALVTNVSHDLKTPLTSIISYVDLLSKEDNLSATASDYVNILVEKSNRLKNIVAELFDLAKSSSGNIDLELTKLDIKKLIEQTLANMEDKIEQSGLQIKTQIPDIPINIIADGNKIYRVFQNIIDNALKYSLTGSRVYIELEEVSGEAIATIKNTASYEMNFTEEEILQRFTRGDKARTTEGSGLGLSIAESFTNVCGGNFKIDIDGDLFKVILGFKLQV